MACETYPRGLPMSIQENKLVGIKTLDLGNKPQDNRWSAKYVSPAGGRPPGRIWTTIANLFRPVIVNEITLYSPTNNATAYIDWDAIVELYSLGNLTFASDKLVALSGLADAISSRQTNTSDDGYLAGLWQSSLPSHLLWTTRSVTKETRGPCRYLQSKSAYIAPS